LGDLNHYFPFSGHVFFPRKFFHFWEKPSLNIKIPLDSPLKIEGAQLNGRGKPLYTVDSQRISGRNSFLDGSKPFFKGMI
jgi:hypothetical protein